MTRFRRDYDGWWRTESSAPIGSDPHDGCWHGPYPSQAEAEAAARREAELAEAALREPGCGDPDCGTCREDPA